MNRESSVVDRDSRQPELKTVRWGPKAKKIPVEWGFDSIEGHSERIIYPQRDKPKEFGGSVPWLRIEDLDGLYVSEPKDEDRYVSEYVIQKMNLRPYPKGTLMCSCSTTMGVCAITERRLLSNQTFAGIVTGNAINTVYLYYSISYNSDLLTQIATGSTILYLPSDRLANFQIPVPPLPEQRKIASVLYTVDQAIQKTEAIIEQAQRVKRGLMQDLFETGYHDHSTNERRIGPQLRKVPEPWDVIDIGELAEYQNGYGFSKDEWSERGRPIIRIQDLTRPEESDVNHFDGEVDEKYEVENGDILVSWSATLGVFRWSRGSAVLNQHIFKVRNIKDVVDDGYLYYALNYALRELERKLHGSTMKHVTRSAFENTEVPLPSLEEQKKIARVLDSIGREIRAEKAGKQNFEQIKRGLMQDLLTGEVRTADKAIEVLDEVAAHG